VRPLRIVVIVLGSVAALVGLALLTGAGVLGWALTTQRDGAGYFTTSTQRFHSRTAAITSRDIDLGRPGPDDWWADRDIATVRIRAESGSDAPIFVGIARDAAVARFLRGVPHDEITDVEYDPFHATYRVHDRGGTNRATPPAAQDFWVARAQGLGTRTLHWHLRAGHWAIVLMHADASAPVVADVDLGVKVRYLTPLAFGLAGAGLVLLLIGAGLIVAAVTRGRDPTAPAETPVAAGVGTAISPPGAPATAEPVHLTGRLDPELSRWQWLVKWFLAIPHFIVLFFLWIAFLVLTIVAFFAILFTGRYPRRIFDFNVGVMRWNWRVHFYATSVLGTDRYPPFTLDAVDYPATLDVAYPQQLSRGLVLVKWWLLAIPHLVIVAALAGAVGFGRGAGGARISLLGVLVLVAAIALLFTARYPRGLFDFLLGIHRWFARVLVYVALMTDRYPPFRLDQGPDEPGTAAPSEPSPAVDAPVVT
jgi:hypothetical protein